MLRLLVVLLLGGCTGCVAQPVEPGRTSAITSMVPLTPRPLCSDGQAYDAEGGCRPVHQAHVGAGGRMYWVAGQDPAASDANEGSEDQPWRTIGRALDTLQPGDAVLIKRGIYSESLRPPRGGTGPDGRITLAAFPGHAVTITGKEELTAWRVEGQTYVHTWPGDPLPLYGSTSDPVFRREMVGVEGADGYQEVLAAVPRRSDLRPGTFMIEGPPNRPSQIVVRLSHGTLSGSMSLWMARPAQLFAPQGADRSLECGHPDTPGWFRLVGLTFRAASNYAQEGAVCAGSEGSRFEDVTVEWTNAWGIDVSGTRHTFIDVRANANGQLGMGGSCSGCVFEGGELIGNNWKGYDPLWEAGGGKWTRSRNTIIRGMTVRDNDGPGLWLDIDNQRFTVEDNWVDNNAVAGIMLEYATTETLVQHNTIRGTRFAGYSGSGILSQAASHNLLLHNTILANEGYGLWLRLDPDLRAPDGNTGVYNSVLVGNAWSASEEGREIGIDAHGFTEAMRHTLDGNVYGRHVANDWRTSTFFYVPDPAADGGFRSDDLHRWQQLTVGDTNSRLLAPEDYPSGDVLSGSVVPLPPSWEDIGAHLAPPRLAPHPGASLR